jgi:hypothetical protein
MLYLTVRTPLPNTKKMQKWCLGGTIVRGTNGWRVLYIYIWTCTKRQHIRVKYAQNHSIKCEKVDKIQNRQAVRLTEVHYVCVNTALPFHKNVAVTQRGGELH